MSTAYERLMAEAIPVRPTPPPPSSPWSAAQQLQHRADLLEALDDWTWDEERRDEQRRHLRLIDQTPTDTDAADTSAA
jgi:hypothetical protein